MANSRIDKEGPIAGIVSVVLFVAGLLMLDLPDGDASSSKILSFYADHGNRATVLISAYLLFLSGLFFLWFLGSLRGVLAEAETQPRRLTSIAFAGGTVFVGMLFAAAACFASVAGDLVFGGEKLVSADAARLLPELGFPLLVIGGMFAAIAMIDASSVLILRSAVLPRWIAWFGFVATVGLLFAGFFLPMILFVLWILFVSIAMLRGNKTVAPPARTEGAGLPGS